MCGLCRAQISFTRHPRPFSLLLNSSGDSGPFTSGSTFFFFIFGGQIFLTLSPAPSPFPPYSISLFLPAPLPPSFPWPSHFSPPFILLSPPFILFSFLLLFLPPPSPSPPPAHEAKEIGAVCEVLRQVAFPNCAFLLFPTSQPTT